MKNNTKFNKIGFALLYNSFGFSIVNYLNIRQIKNEIKH